MFAVAVPKCAAAPAAAYVDSTSGGCRVIARRAGSSLPSPASVGSAAGRATCAGTSVPSQRHARTSKTASDGSSRAAELGCEPPPSRIPPTWSGQTARTARRQVARSSRVLLPRDA
eukprot:778520-Prymnesium_polylepis.1